MNQSTPDSCSDLRSSESGPRLLRRLLGYILNYKLCFVLAIIGMVGNGLTDTVFVSTIKPLLDDGINAHNSNVLFWMPWVVIGIVALRGLSQFLSDYNINYIGNTVVMTLQREVFAKLLRMPVSFYDRHKSGELIAKITYDAEQVKDTASDAIVTIVREATTVIGLLCLMIWTSWQLTIIFFVIGPVVGFIVSTISRRIRRYSRSLQQSVGNITSETGQMLLSHREVMMFNGYDVENERFAKSSGAIRDTTMKVVKIQAVGSPLVQLIASSALAAILVMATNPDLVGGLTAGGFATIITAMMMLLKPIKTLMQVNNKVQRGITGLQSLFGIIDHPTEKDSATGTEVLKDVKGEVSFRDVTFTYPGKDTPAVRGITLEMRPGTTTALVGRSGSGKSTLAALITRFYDPDSGTVSIDGKDIKDFTLESLRGSIGLVSQNVMLFNDTVAANIAYADGGKHSREEIEAAAKAANADSFIRKLPNGYDTVLGENGSALSGGQRQRIAIARALLRKTPILILDEATSALDSESEEAIQEALRSLDRSITKIVIAHRLSTVEDADCIAVMDEGRIIESGTHRELMERKDGAYRRLRELQQ
ncbi:MAG: lipid A export permease/ATP-binding protein MsbA [Succinivibrionaceae bacterium]|jgi:subfamily B ATP-binding cassette protein MsbA|nr:lipid A export permease/ATP-binding protein MsbA [Succinivibrionaceae bacterium]MDY6274397.1 lipid A export permease/ATP-binding protein MsbA [Succinivibrionaceae bacterium]MDY6337395.1 lipid A export permease/ATP-binding protein MsbA [Succinivibrionaceae bacterium]MDY6376283.1 lipid A export permease/ATP-binding protein MsbA [Succinivibrionaceae bacterium]